MADILTSKRVDELTAACLYSEDAVIPDDAPITEGIVNRYQFDPARIAEHADEIGRLLSELPDEFQAGGGGGWSFLNACQDKHGNQWTGLHQSMERLLCLGIAAGKARWLMPREIWAAFPGGVPYVQVGTASQAA